MRTKPEARIVQGCTILAHVLWRDCHSGNTQKGYLEASSAENRVATFCEAKLGVETRDTICIVCFHPCAEFFTGAESVCATGRDVSPHSK